MDSARLWSRLATVAVLPIALVVPAMPAVAADVPFRVESLAGGEGAVYCFEVRGSRGYLTMDVPQVYLVWGATHTLVELRVTGSDPAPAGEASGYPFAAKVDTEGCGCSGVLVAPQWLATVKGCFADVR